MGNTPSVESIQIVFKVGKGSYRYNCNDKSVVRLGATHKTYPIDPSSVNDQIAVEFIERIKHLI